MRTHPSTLFLLAATIALHANNENTFPGSASIAYSPKYISEGQSNLESGGIIAAEIAVSHQAWTLGLWQGHGQEINYRETELSIGYHHATPLVDIDLSLSHLDFSPDDEEDQEGNITLTYNACHYCQLASSLTYSKEAEGSFIEMTAWQDWQYKPQFTISLSATLAYDWGYTGADSNDFNHLDISLSLDHKLTEHIHIFCQLTHIIALSQLHNSGQNNLNNASIGLAYHW